MIRLLQCYSRPTRRPPYLQAHTQPGQSVKSCSRLLASCSSSPALLYTGYTRQPLCFHPSVKKDSIHVHH
ncbi:hypothetical protein E2C01_065063 [Portunus trituberculatus]|uniref:Uncharacterized protein n=1 Tax=Portunus trituberculatus TaxID=210409 RepID=A0A5B7HQQ5_PORTR|nr:hypothetical protein [Portunus trituberculatus]